MAGHVPYEYPELVCAGGYLRHVTELINVGFRAERAVSPRDGGVWWVVLEHELRLDGDQLQYSNLGHSSPITPPPARQQ